MNSQWQPWASQTQVGVMARQPAGSFGAAGARPQLCAALAGASGKRNTRDAIRKKRIRYYRQQDADLATLTGAARA